MKKVKRFQEGGYEDTDDYKNLMKAQAREDANAAEPGTETTSEFMKRTGTKANPPMSRTFTSKGPIVTKEQMKKAGFDNLRDYLNAERGLTRRSDAPSVAKSESKKSEKTFMFNGKKYTTNLAGSKKPAARTAAQERGDTDKIRSSMGMRSLGQEAADDEKIASATGVRPVSAMKKGGMVKSSASKRADGCATKGKTKGRMV